jgi:hypothetical protein
MKGKKLYITDENGTMSEITIADVKSIKWCDSCCGYSSIAKTIMN